MSRRSPIGRRSLAIAVLFLWACRSAEEAGPPLSERLVVSFEGATQTQAALEAVVQAELLAGPRHAITKSEIDDAAWALENFYQGAGYPEVEVTYEFEERGAARPRARFTIREGPLVAIAEIAGLERVGSDLRDALLGEVRVGAPFVRDELEEAADALRDSYLERGYLAVQVDEPVVERLADDAVRVVFGLLEGPRHELRAVSITGEAVEVVIELDSVRKAAIGRMFVPHVAYELRAAVLRAHGKAGYPDCEVGIETTVHESDGAVELALRVDPGPRVRIDKIVFRGDTKIPDRRMRSRIELEPGDTYDAERLERSFQNLYATGLFDSVRFDLEGEGKKRTLVVETIEAPSLEFFVEPGYGSYEGLRVRAGVDENNLWGSGRRGGFEGWLSALARGVELQLADPFLLRTPVTGQVTFYAKDREEPSFTVDEVGTELSLRRQWDRELSTTLALEYSETRVSDVSLVSSIPPQFVDDAEIGELTFALAYDTRDNVLMPNEGGLARFHSGIALDALGSSIEIFEYGLDLSTVLQVGDHTQLAARAGGSIVAPYGDTSEVSIQRRLFNGGENTVRSFREDELGPKDPNGEPVGGEARTLVSLEARRMLRGNVSGALFYDLGNVELDYRDFFQFDGMRHGIGAGLRYLLPIGPLRLDAAWNPDPHSGEDDWVVHFAVGLP